MADSSPVNLPAVTGDVLNYEVDYIGFTIKETSGTTRASVTLYDCLGAPSGTTKILEEITLAAGESERAQYPTSRKAAVGIHAVVTGGIEGAVFI